MGWTGKESGSYATKLATTPIMAKYTNESSGTQLIKSFTMWLGIPGDGVVYDWNGATITGTGNPIDFYVSINGIESSHVTVDNEVGASGSAYTGESGTGRYPNYSQLKEYTVSFDEDVIVTAGATVDVMGTYNNDMVYLSDFIVARKRDPGDNEYVSGEVVNATYTITYNANGGSGAPASQTKTYGVDLILSTSIPTREGYNFVSWNIKPNGQDTSYQPGDVFRSNEDTTLYAIWELKKYTVSYNANGGSGAPADQIKEHGKSLILSSSEPTTPKKYTVTYDANGGSVSPASKSVSCTFDSWIANTSGKQFYPGDTYDINEDVELYAQWINNSAGTLATPTRDGYKFIGWFTEVEDGIQVTADTIIDSDITLYAIWEDKKCPIWVYTVDGWTHFSGTALRYDGTGWNKLEGQE